MIVNVGSIGGKMTLPWMTLYSASKYAVAALTEGLRMELMRDGMRTMLVCPGYVKTGFQQHVTAGEAPERREAGAPLRHHAEECAAGHPPRCGARRPHRAQPRRRVAPGRRDAPHSPPSWRRAWREMNGTA